MTAAMEAMEYPEGATPLDPDELSGLRFKHVTTASSSMSLSRPTLNPACDGSRGTGGMC